MNDKGRSSRTEIQRRLICNNSQVKNLEVVLKEKQIYLKYGVISDAK